jgi:hypothetical protein
MATLLPLITATSLTGLIMTSPRMVLTMVSVLRNNRVTTTHHL